MDPSDVDLKMMRRCVDLSADAVRANELPFSCVICRGDQIIAEATPRVCRDGDVTRHAELIAISDAQRQLGRKDLSDCTLYSNVEPCPMCSFPIRETRIGRVVYSISSPLMGGFSKWNVLSDQEISDVMPQVFGGVPQISGGLMYRDAAAVWRSWNPLFWFGIRLRGCLAEGNNQAMVTLQVGAPPRSLWQRFKASRQPSKTRGAPNGILIDALVAPDHAIEAVWNLQETFEKRWLPKHGDHMARIIFYLQSVGVVVSFWTEWAIKRIDLIKLFRRPSDPDGHR